MRRAHPRRVLAAVAFANLVVAALHFGLAAAGPVLRDQLGLNAAQLGLLLAMAPLGLMLGTFAWGELADRVDEQRVLTAAFAGFSIVAGFAALAAAGDVIVWFGILLLASGMFGSAAHSAGGRAISAAYPPERHGLVLAIRHTAIPIGGAIGGLLVPMLGRAAGIEAAIAVLAGAGIAAMCGIAWGIPRSLPVGHPNSIVLESVGASPLRDRRMWLLSTGCACLAFVQLGIGSFLTVQLVDAAAVSISIAALVFTVSQLLGAAGRIVLGLWSDRLGSRVGVLRGVALAALMCVLAAVLPVPDLLRGILFVAALVIVTSCNGVAVAAAASLANPGRTGATLGMQTTLNAAACTIAPVLLGVVLQHLEWQAFALVLAAALVTSMTCLWWLAAHQVARAAPAIAVKH